MIKKSTSISGKFKNIMIHEGSFVDADTSEIVDIIGILEKAYGDNSFDISTSMKEDEDIDI